jgi:zona occludens toxin (predicted ATPase)
MYKIKRASGSAFPCIFSYDFRPTIRKAGSALHWDICIMFELHGKLRTFLRLSQNMPYRQILKQNIGVGEDFFDLK